MVAEVLFAGGKRDSIVPSGAVVDSTANAASYNSTYTDSYLEVTTTATATVNFYTTGTNNTLAAADVATGETFWMHFDYAVGNTTSTTNRVVWQVNDASAQPWLRARMTNTTGTLQWEYNSNTGASPSWSSVGSTWTIVAGSTIYTIDVKLELGSPHSFEFSVNGTLHTSGTFTSANLVQLSQAVLTHHSTSASTSRYSQILVTRDIATVGAFVRYSRATAAGANTGWTNTYTNVNEAVGSDTAVQSAASAGLRSTHAMGNVTVPVGSEIKSVFHWLRAKNDGVAPNNIKSVIRSASTDYVSDNLVGIGTSFGAIGARYDTDPATSAQWTESGWNAAEAGYESAT